MPALSKASQLKDNGKKKGIKAKKKRVPLKDLPLEKWPISKLTVEADRVFSLFIRQRDADKMGIAKCITCELRAPWSDLTNGHYINRGNWNTRFNEKNCNTQCALCNWREHVDKARKTVYALNIVRKYGATVLEELDAIANKPFDKKTTSKRKLLIEVIKKYAQDK